MINDNQAGLQMPVYVGHKRVGALRIKSIEPLNGNTHRLTFHDSPHTLITEPGWVERHNAQAGGYYVRYEDGYRSWSPAQAFDKGYTPESEWGLQPTQEPKYMVTPAGRLANRKSGIAIPDDEPLITFRAKDLLLPSVMRFYIGLLPDGEHRDNALQELERIEAFQRAYSAYVRLPD